MSVGGYPLFNSLSSPLLYPPSFHALLAQLSAQHKADAAQDATPEPGHATAPDEASDVPPDASPRGAGSDASLYKILKTENEEEADEKEKEKEKEEKESEVRGVPQYNSSVIKGLDPRASELPRPMDVKGLAALRALEQYRTLDLNALEEYRRALEARTLEARAAQFTHARAQAEAQLTHPSTPSPDPAPPTHTLPESPSLQEESLPVKRPEYHIDALLKKEV
ncbi:hypothetical protein E2C01_025300 [Portunus trituberculatus]|uniref:Uncharacterized protein n=1 Tax=Portunus trituberculatus TaxID=210409 RepID=A0A5B7EET1_PORTR|nr:hypothetical protein [Portunus trituberculatus]